jgi:hypothetical protein
MLYNIRLWKNLTKITKTKNSRRVNTREASEDPSVPFSDKSESVHIDRLETVPE